MAKKNAKPDSHKHRFGARRGIWKGSISFGLVNIPVILESAEEDKKIRFRMLDKRDNAPVGYRQINKKTQEEISRKDIVKGYEYEKGEFVLMSESDFKKANVKATSTIAIEDFVELESVDPLLFEKPYYMIPQKGSEKGYVLLRDVLKKTEKAAIATIVMHTVQHLVALIAREDYIVLEILRFANQVKELHEIDFLDNTAMRSAKISPRELAVAEQLVEGMSSDWKPDKYKDTYRDDLMKLIKNKVRRGATAEVEEVETAAGDEDVSNVIDLTALLKKSLGGTARAKRKKSPSAHSRAR
ncbi:MAG TPA: Ku protein [Bdellovibrionales bacterium]|nr:Ku protein [Bdellovibrionales bacterium]